MLDSKKMTINIIFLIRKEVIQSLFRFGLIEVQFEPKMESFLPIYKSY